jgi:hypothetical protein
MAKLMVGDRVDIPKHASKKNPGTVSYVDNKIVRVHWDDGQVGVLEWDNDAAANAYRLVKVGRIPNPWELYSSLEHAWEMNRLLENIWSFAKNSPNASKAEHIMLLAMEPLHNFGAMDTEPLTILAHRIRNQYPNDRDFKNVWRAYYDRA